MSNVSEWAVTAGGNTSAPPDGAPENMLPGKVNDCMREIQAAVSRWYQDSNGTLQTTGGTTAYSLTTNSGNAALSDIPLLVFRVNVANTGTTTLHVDGLGAKPWRKDATGANYLAGELVSGQVVVVAYNSADDDFYTVGPSARSEVPTGTLMLFQQTSAPTGWTKQATHDNKALRVVTGSASSGGTYAFTDVLSARTIAVGHLPSYNLSFSLAALDHVHLVNLNTGTGSANHNHTYARYNNLLDSVQGNGGNDDLWQGTSTQNTGSDGFNHFHNVFGNTGGTNLGNPTVFGTISSGGSGTAIEFSVQYVDVIIASKD